MVRCDRIRLYHLHISPTCNCQRDFQLVQSNALLCAADLKADRRDLIGVAGGHLQVGPLQLLQSHALLPPSKVN
jgi:hypothetical protein